MDLNQKPFYFMRHGQTDWNLRNLCVGQTDLPLNDTGIEQAKATAIGVRAIAPSTIFYSPLLRARHTAFLISAGLACQMFCEINLKEVCLGVKEGQPENDPSEDFVLAWQRGLQIEGGETFVAFRHRIVSAINKCLLTADGEPPLFVAHSGVFMALASACGILDQDVGYCRLYRFVPTDLGWSLILVDQRN